MRKPGLVIATLIGVAVLFSLGWWQKERRAWKLGVINEVEQAANAAPFTRISQIEDALARGEPIDFRRVAVAAEPVADAPVFRVFRAGGQEIEWEIFAPVRSTGRTVFAGLGTISDGADIVADVPDTLYGHVRLDRGAVRGELASNPDANRYYRPNAEGAWSDAVPDVETRFWIDHDPSISGVDGIPVRTPELPNRHFEYMLTWWSFALILIVISAVLYRRDEAEPS